MKNTNKRFLGTIITAYLIFIFAGCTNNTLKRPSTDSETVSNSNSKYIVTGSVDFDSAALPKAIISQDTLSSRTASGNFSENLWSFDIEAVQDTQTIPATIKKYGTQYNYVFDLPSSGKWNISVKFLINNIVVSNQSRQITIPTDAQSHYTVTNPFSISYTPRTGADKTGSINLKIQNSSSLVSSITWEWLDKAKNGTTPINNATKTVSGANETVTFDFDSINGGNYKVKISFKDASDKVLYSCYENIVVFFDFVTDTWYGPSPYINNSNEFVYEDFLSDTFAKDKKQLEIPDGSSAYILWSDFEYEPDSLFSSTPIQNELGGQIFTSLTEGMTITEPVNCGLNSSRYRNSIYAPPYRYVNNYAGFGKDPTFDLSEIIYSVFGSQLIESFTSSMVLDDYLYFLFSIEDYPDPMYYIGRYGINDHKVAFTEANLNDINSSKCTAFTVVHTTDTDTGFLYYAVDATNPRIYRKPFEITESGFIHFNTEGTYKAADEYLSTFAKSTSPNTYELTDKFSVSDMVVVGEYLYVLIYLSDSYKEYYTLDSESQYQLVENNYLSTGGVMKFKEDNSQLETTLFDKDSTWTNSNSSSTHKKVLGLYTYPDPSHNVTYYDEMYEPINELSSYEYDGITYNYYKSVPAQPPLESGNPNSQYLYGPRKFLSASSTELVFIDDGGYIQDPPSPDAEPVSLPVNRIVTLDLSTEEFSFVNVNATFSASYSPVTRSFTTNPYSGGLIIPDPGPGKP